MNPDEDEVREVFLSGDTVRFTMDGEEIGTGTAVVDYTDDIQVFDLQVGPVKQGESITRSGTIKMDVAPEWVEAIEQLGQGYKRVGVAAEDFKESLEGLVPGPAGEWAMEEIERARFSPPGFMEDPACMEEIRKAASALGPGYHVEVEQLQHERVVEFFAILHTPRGSVSQEVSRYDFRDAFGKLGVIE